MLPPRPTPEGWQPSPDEATRDHLVTALRFGRVARLAGPVVLACRQCNLERNAVETKTLSGHPVAPELRAKFASAGALLN